MGGRNADHDRVKEEEDHEEEESLSLCDLPINEGNINNGNNNLQQSSHHDSSVVCNSDNDDDDGEESEEEEEEEFNFCDSFKISKEDSEMCAADELFFQGQILPLRRRHSVSSCTDTDTDAINNRNGRLKSDRIHIRNASISRSESDSLDRCYSGGLTSTAASSRSNSINSHHSSSSGNSSISAAASKRNKPTSRARPPRLVPNNFQYSSHPSPKPQIRIPSGLKNSNPNSNSNSNSNRNSGLWSLFRVGLMTPPEIAIRDLKNRSNSMKNYNPQSFGSRNSTCSSSNSSMNPSAKRKQPGQFLFNKNGVLLFGGCKCAANSVGPNPRKIGHDVHGRSGEVITENGHVEEMKHHAKKMTKHQQEGEGERGGKQALSRHRTFEWLKQLSLEPAASAMDQT